jgi:uncharacterized protein YndB with AHSA1/START domain
MPDSYTVERTVQVQAPASAVYERIVDFHRWPAWSPYEGLDPSMTRTYPGADAGVGAVYEWSGNMKAGAGRMEIVEAVPDERVVIELAFSKPFRSHSTSTFRMDGDTDAGEAATVTWSVTGPLTTTTRVMGVFRSMDKLMGPAFEKGLTSLKADAEAAGPPPTM